MTAGMTWIKTEKHGRFSAWMDSCPSPSNNIHITNLEQQPLKDPHPYPIFVNADGHFIGGRPYKTPMILLQGKLGSDHRNIYPGNFPKDTTITYWWAASRPQRMCVCMHVCV